MDVPFLISDHNGASFFHSPFTSSLSLFSLGTFDLSNLDDDDVMFITRLVTPTPPEEGLLNVHPLEEGLHISNQN
jgi:hypothetical protein